MPNGLYHHKVFLWYIFFVYFLDYKVLLHALELLEREKLSLSRFNDVVILVHAMEKNYLATFDQRLRRLAAKLKVEVLPEEI